MSEVPVRVAVRVRPLVGQEKVHQVPQCVEFVANKPQLILGKDRGFTFDYVFQPDASQVEVYESCIEPLVKSCLEGYNATVFAYGQTGSGKTYTIGGLDTGGLMDDQYGIIPRAVKQIFQAFEESKQKIVFEVHVSYIEIYLEELRDLLDLDTSSKDIHIREDDKGNTVVVGAMEQPVQSLDEVMSCLDTGSAARHTGATNMNEQSSRSHAIFTMYIGQKPFEDPEQITSQENVRKQSQESDVDYMDYKYSKFHFVDLAGSERVDRTGNVGDRFKESVQINTGLLALGNVISALADARKKILHVPYRESKVTRLLKDSLGGNARTTMITCLSPAAADFAENLNTLKFATRARNIRNKPVINRDPQNTKLAEMQNQIMALREELQRRRVSSIGSAATTDTSEHVKELEEELNRCRSVSEHYSELLMEASVLLASLHKAGAMSNHQTSEYEHWTKRIEQIRSRPIWTPTSGRQQQLDVIVELKKNNQKLKSDLASDEEIFAEKAKEINNLNDRIRTLEEQNNCLKEQLKQSLERVRKQEDQLFQQQLQLNQRHDGVSVSRNKLPLIPETRTRAQTAPVDNTADPSTEGRNLHSSPSTFNTDRMLQGFRARSQLLVSRLEEQDEVLCTLSDTSDSEDEHRPEHAGSRALGKTWKVKTNRTPGLVDGLRACGGGVVKTEGVPSSHEDQEALLSNLRCSTKLMGKEMKEAELGLHEAQQKLRDLTINIKLKEEFIKELVKSDKEAKEMKKRYTEKTKSMRQEVEKAKSDLEETKRTLETYESRANNELNEKQKLESEYKRKMQVMEAKIATLRRKQKDSEKVSAMHDEREKKVQDLMTQMERMRAQQDQLTKRLREESDRKARLERDMQKQLQRVKELEQQTSQQQKVLKRKTEEVANVQRKLRTVGKQGSDDSTASEEQAKLEKQRLWLDSEVEKILKRKQAIETLEEELKKREQIVQQREAMVAEKSGLEIKKLRSSQVLSKDIIRLSVQVNEVESQIKEKGDEMKRSHSNNAKEELHSLARTRVELSKQREILEQKLQQGTLLDPNEERRLIELDEGIEVLEAAIEYTDEQIHTQQREIEDDVTPDTPSLGLVDRLKGLSQDQAAGLLSRYFEKVVQLREEDRKLRLQCADLEVRLDEQERIIGELGRSLNQSKLQADRKMIEQQKEGEKRIQFLISKLKDAENAGGGDPAISTGDTGLRMQQLEKDLYYYKKTCRDLKKKLRERMTGMVESAESGIAGASAIVETSDHHNAKQIKDSLLGKSSSQPSTPVRMSRKGLRQLSAQEIQQRKPLTVGAQSSVVASNNDGRVSQSVTEEPEEESIIQDSIEQGNNPWA
ncbi:kinesin-like protein KIF27 isoform X2 [Nematostella vectensis]|uniref:kinesin-like protein KIF27 isoform X2 n=1 Tax=Nematostella vectensis TaxID=45351 RepID=UPI0013902588|nr:kinesin-like protein KIF27 isoform X2 [Nematostella vectensis]